MLQCTAACKDSYRTPAQVHASSFSGRNVKEIYNFSLVQDASLSEEWVLPAAGRIATQRGVAERDHKRTWQKPAAEELNWGKSIGNWQDAS